MQIAAPDDNRLRGSERYHAISSTGKKLRQSVVVVAVFIGMDRRHDGSSLPDRLILTEIDTDEFFLVDIANRVIAAELIDKSVVGVAENGAMRQTGWVVCSSVGDRDRSLSSPFKNDQIQARSANTSTKRKRVKKFRSIQPVFSLACASCWYLNRLPVVWNDEPMKAFA